MWDTVALHSPGVIMLFVRICGLLLMAVPAHALAAPAATAATREEAVREDALELARLLNPADLLMGLAGRSFDEAFDKGMAAEGSSETLEKEFPGLIAELRQAIREATLADLRADMPVLHRRYAKFFGASFTPDEIAELLAFYRSPTGAKIIRAKFASLDVSTLSDRFAVDQNAKLSAGDVRDLNQGAMPGVWKDMSADDIKALMAFGLNPVAKKLKAIAPQMAEIEADIANEPDRALDAAIEAATRKVYELHGLDAPAGD